MTPYMNNVALEAELAYRRERLQTAAQRGTRGRRSWAPTPRRVPR